MSVPTYSWPLMTDPFNLWDRLRLSAFLLNLRNRWTQGEQVKTFEREMAQYIGCKHAVFVSSGSTANTLLAMYLKDNALAPARDTVVFPSTTWTTSVAPFLREGFKPHFIDITFRDLSMNLDVLETYLLEHHETTAAVFVTSLLGMCPHMSRLIQIQSRYPEVKIWMDNCENTLGTYCGCNVSSFTTSTTSTYYGHLLNSVEGGFVFTNSDSERDYYLMARNHGMTRSVDDPSLYRNPDVDARFDFHFLGTNFRNTDIAAFIGRMDLAKANDHARRRRDLYEVFTGALITDDLLVFEGGLATDNVMFAIPLIVNPQWYTVDAKRLLKRAIEEYCNEVGAESRPIISGNLMAQRAYKQYGKREDYPVSEYIHQYGIYLGLYPSLSEDKVRALAGFINEL